MEMIDPITIEPEFTQPLPLHSADVQQRALTYLHLNGPMLVEEWHEAIMERSDNAADQGFMRAAMEMLMERSGLIDYDPITKMVSVAR